MHSLLSSHAFSQKTLDKIAGSSESQLLASRAEQTACEASATIDACHDFCSVLNTNWATDKELKLLTPADLSNLQAHLRDYVDLRK